MRAAVSAIARQLYRYVPLPATTKRRLKGLVFEACGPLLGHTVAYRAWAEQKERQSAEARARVDETAARLAREYVGGRPSPTPSVVHLEVDTPTVGATLDDVLIVSGWAFSPSAAIARIDAWLDDRYLGPVQYGIVREDVPAHHAWVSIERCGFFDVLPCPAASGPAIVRLRACDRHGESSEVSIGVNQAPVAAPILMVDGAERRGNEAVARGWALAPPEELPLLVRLVIDGVEGPVERVRWSRPDVWTDQRGHSQAFRSGFHVRGPIPATMGGDGRGREVQAAVTLIGTSGVLATRPVTLKRVDAAVATDERAWQCLAAEHRRRTGARASIVDWSDGAGIAPACDATVFAPLRPSARTLPYADGSVDFVVVPDGLDDVSAEAARVAAAGVIRLPGAGAAPGAGGKRAFEVDWRVTPAPSPLPSASIIIPTFNAAVIVRECLEHLERTVPRDLDVEILVVDDGSSDETEAVVREQALRDDRVRYVRNDTNLQFLRACNRGAGLATRDVLVFLNNDTAPSDGWLEPLLELLRDRADAGAVGAKLVYPNGTLQEAGGIIFNDGTGWNFGRGAVQPDHPLYECVREVDYCSGAVLATWHALFDELGRFDERYVPMYYEDTDYCFELRRRGRRVYYQPASVVVHLEGYTSGTDTTRGMKAYQERNHSIFCEKWALALAEQPAPPHVADRAAEYRFVSRRPSGGRRVLVCAPLMPEFDRESGSKRIDDLITLLLEAGWEVSFYAQSAGPWSRRYIRTLQQRGVMVYAGVESQEMGDLFTWGRHELIALGQFDLAILAFWHVAEKFMDAIRSLSPRTRIVVDSIDLHFLREMRRMLNDPAIALLPGEGRYLCELAREVNTYHGADAVFAVSQKEADLVNDLLSVPHRALAIGDTERGPSDVQGFDGRRGILLLGSFRHLPNLEAAEHFLTEILPLLDRRLLAEHPVYIVGTDMEKTSLPRTVRDPAVRLVGWVPTVEPYLDTCRITILPLKHGAGTKRKMIQALIHGTPSVSTSVGTEGLDLVDGTHVLVADTPSAFAAAIERLLEDRELWSRLSEAGRRHGQARHGHAAATAALQAAVADVMARPIRPLHPPVLP